MQIPTLLARAQIAEAEADYAKVRRVLDPLTRMASGARASRAGVMAMGRRAGQRPGHRGTTRRRGHVSAPARGPGPRSRAPLHHGAPRLRAGPAIGRDGRSAAARRAFEESLALLDGLPLRYDLARVNFAYGQTLRRAGKRREADAVISTARDLYLSLGAHTYVQRCERELKAGGLHPMRGPRGQRRAHPAGGGGDRRWSRRGCRTGRSPPSCTCRRRPCSTTSPGSTPSSASVRERSWPPCGADGARRPTRRHLQTAGLRWRRSPGPRPARWFRPHHIGVLRPRRLRPRQGENTDPQEFQQTRRTWCA